MYPMFSTNYSRIVTLLPTLLDNIPNIHIANTKLITKVPPFPYFMLIIFGEPQIKVKPVEISWH